MSTENENIVREINESFERGEIEGFLAHCDENIVWTMTGEAQTSGKDAIREWMGGANDCEPPVIGVDRMISTDDAVVCYGEMSMKTKDGEAESYSYCDIYTFRGGKVTELKTFVMKSKSDDSAGTAGA